MVPLPCTEAREMMIKTHLEGRCAENMNYNQVR